MKLLKYIKIKFFIFALLVPVFAYSGNISSGSNIGYAWGDKAGYINFGLTAGSVTVNNSNVTGYAWDSINGWMNLGPIAIGGVEYGVKNNGSGNLSGYAWSQGAGWLSFSGVTINSSGKFTGIADGSTLYGKISFDCSNCNVTTSWRPVASGWVKDFTTGSSVPVNELVPIYNFPKYTPFIDLFNLINKRVGLGAFVGRAPEGRVDKDKHIDVDNIPKYNIIYLPSKRFVDRLEDFETNLIFSITNEGLGVIPAVYTIEDYKGRVIYKDLVNLDLTLNNIFNKKYTNISLPDGHYIARVSFDGSAYFVNFRIVNRANVMSASVGEIKDSKLILITLPLVLMLFIRILIKLKIKK